MKAKDFSQDATVNGMVADCCESEWATAIGVSADLIFDLVTVSNSYNDPLEGKMDWESGTIACREYVQTHIMPLLPD